MGRRKRSPVAKAAAPAAAKTLLLVGPKPPPIGGSPLTVQAVLAELERYPGIRVALVNTSPGLDVRKKMTGFNFEKVGRTVAIVPRYLRVLGRSDSVLVFANDLFAITLVPILVFLARLARRPFYLKPVGAGLDLFINARKKPLKKFLLGVLGATDGILAQTRRLQKDLGGMGLSRVHYLPGCRPPIRIAFPKREASGELRLVFLGHIALMKGPLILLDALRLLGETAGARVSCDFYGPIHDELRDEFLDRLGSMPGVRYRGMAEPGKATEIISGYDALVLPTCFDTEGHPGVIIEAMHARVPVITTQIRTLSELVTDGENGFLVPTRDVPALAEAIRRLAVDPDLRARMAEAHFRRGIEFRADVVVAALLKIVFPGEVFESARASEP